jgi:hypothetical protein
MIDWRKVAKSNGLTNEEFEKEIFTVAACLGAITLDSQKEGDCLKFSCSDDVGRLELYIKRSD